MSGNTLFLLLSMPILLVSCNSSEREKKLDEREKTLTEKENIFALKEADYESLLKLRDSLYAASKDSVAAVQKWPSEIAGKWNSKIICTESSCSDYVIGDQRTDIWDFVSDSIQTSVLISNSGNKVRNYSGKYENKEIRMSYKTDSTSKKIVETQILLDNITPEKIRGTRTVTVNNSCMAKFSVELVRPSK